MKGKFFGLMGIVAGATLATVTIVNAVFENPPSDDIDAWVRSWLGVGIKVRAEKEIQRLVERDPSDINQHYRWITLHYSRPTRSGKTDRDDKEIEGYYERLARHKDPRLADIGRYGQGLVLSAGQLDCEQALDWFDQVSDRSLPYLNNSIGNCLQRLDREPEATVFFEREIALGGNVGGASTNLAQNLMKLGDLEALTRKIKHDEVFQRRLPASVHRKLSLFKGEMVEYLGLVIRGRLDRVTTAGLVAAGLILGVWFSFLYRLDVFEPETFHALVTTLLMGMVGGVLCTVPYDLSSHWFGAGLNGTTVNDLLYCIFGIGLIEELTKIVPLLVVMRWTSWADEPVDIVIYVSTSALGFAFVENLLYFHPMGLGAIHGRAFTATIMHLSLSTVAAYGLLEAKRRKWPKSRALPRVAALFGIAVVVHGLYDFFLLGEGWVQILRPMALLIVVFMVIAFQHAVANGLSGSPFWDDRSNRRVINLWWYLCLSLSGVVLVEYLLLAGNFGPTAAGLGFLSAATSSLVLIIILVSQLGLIEVVRHRWLPLIDRSAFQGQKKKKGP